jgi:hypothetical protein
MLQIVCGEPPVASTLLSVPAAKKPIQRLSGDQNGLKAPTVPGMARAADESSGRMNNCVRPSVVTTKASACPSGAMTPD